MEGILEKEREKDPRKSTPEWSVKKKKERKDRKCTVFSILGGGLK